MRFTQVFEDLGDFVSTYRGRISREGMLLHTDTLYQEGTVLALEISLEESLPLIRGTAGVVHLERRSPESEASYAVVLEFLQLDQDSQGFVDRLAERLESDGAELFSLDPYVIKGRRGTRPSAPAPELETAIDDEDQQDPTEAEPVDDIEEWVRMESAHRRRSPGRRVRWLLGIAASGAVIALAVIAVIGGLPQFWIIPSVDPGPLPVASEIDVAAFTPRPPTCTPVIPTRPGMPTNGAMATPRTIAPSTTRATAIHTISWSDGDRATLVSIVADGPLDEAAVGHFLMTDDPKHRLVLYLYGIGSSGLDYRTSVAGARLDAIRVWYHEDKTPVQLHIVLDLASDRVAASPPLIEGNLLLVKLTEEPRVDAER
jgi:hypothetical protein